MPSFLYYVNEQLDPRKFEELLTEILPFFSLFLDYRILKHLVMQLCADHYVRRQERHRDEHILVTFALDVTQIRVLALDPDNDKILGFHFCVLSCQPNVSNAATA